MENVIRMKTARQDYCQIGRRQMYRELKLTRQTKICYIKFSLIWSVYYKNLHACFWVFTVYHHETESYAFAWPPWCCSAFYKIWLTENMAYISGRYITMSLPGSLKKKRNRHQFKRLVFHFRHGYEFLSFLLTLETTRLHLKWAAAAPTNRECDLSVQSSSVTHIFICGALLFCAWLRTWN